MTTRARDHDPHVGLIASYLRELRKSGKRDTTAAKRSSQVERWRITASPSRPVRDTASPQR